MEFGLEIFIGKWYNWKGTYDMNVIDGNKQKGKWLVVECKALRWAKANNAPPKGSTWWIPMVDGMIVTSHSRLKKL